MTAINKQITFRLAPFPPFWAWYPAKFAAPKMKVSRRQHCIIVYAVKCGEVERESERRKGIRATVSFGACRFRQWRDKTKAKSGQNFWRADLQGYNSLAKPTWGSGNYYMHWYGIREHRVLRRPRPAPTPLQCRGWATLLLCMCRHFRSVRLGNLCHDTNSSRQLYWDWDIMDTEATHRVEWGWLVAWLAIGVKPSTLGSSACCCRDQVDQVNSGHNNQ